MTLTLDRHGPTGLVTGASSGIGEAFAREPAGRSFDLVLVARRADRLAAIATELEGRHRVRVTPLAADLTQPDAGGRIGAATPDIDFGLLVGNAGFSTKGEHGAADLLTGMLMVNCNAPCG